MANLGSDDTPIAGESFGLPSGWSITENAAGEVVIQDSGANVVFRRDETAGEWVTDSIDAESVSVEETKTDSLDVGIQNPDNLSDNRSFGTEYQNTTGHAIEWSVVAEVSLGEDIDMRPDTGSASGSLVNLQEVELNDADGRTRLGFTHLIPDGNYYKIREFGNATLRRWHERVLER